MNIGKVVSILFWVISLFGSHVVAAEVEVQRLPESAYRSQAAVDASGTIHIVYAHQEQRGNLFYVQKRRGEDGFSLPIPVNSAPNCTAAFNMAVGEAGRVHVLIRPNAKYSREKLGRPVKFDDLKYMLYCRLNDAGTAFEAERDLSGRTFAFEGVGAILADAEGGVWVFWHGLEQPGPEHTRRIYRVVSRDQGKTFSEPEPITTTMVGTCACCSMSGALAPDGRMYLAVRSSESTAYKDSYLLTSADQGKTFAAKLLERWPNAGCPGSVYSLAATSGGAYVAWETFGVTKFSSSIEPSTPIEPPIRDRRSRSPTLVANEQGEVLFVWSEAELPQQFAKGADLAWQVFAKDGTPLGERQVVHGGLAGGWSTPAAYARQDGKFVIFCDGSGSLR